MRPLLKILNATACGLLGIAGRVRRMAEPAKIETPPAVADSRSTGNALTTDAKRDTRAPTVAVTLKDRALTISLDTDTKARLESALATTSYDFVCAQLGHIERVLTACNDGSPSQQDVNAVLAVIHGAKPKNELEAMLVIQAALCHALAMKKARHFAGSTTIQQGEASSVALNRLTKTFSTHLDTLSRMRRKGRQKVTVKHVHVHAGGQAIVGSNVTTNPTQGGGGFDQNSGQPHGTADGRTLTLTASEAMPSQDAARNVVSIARRER